MRSAVCKAPNPWEKARSQHHEHLISKCLVYNISIFLIYFKHFSFLACFKMDMVNRLSKKHNHLWNYKLAMSKNFTRGQVACWSKMCAASNKRVEDNMWISIEVYSLLWLSISTKVILSWFLRGDSWWDWRLKVSIAMHIPFSAQFHKWLVHVH